MKAVVSKSRVIIQHQHTAANYYFNQVSDNILQHIISFLIEKGVDVNGYPDEFYGFHTHASALHQAVYSGSLKSVQLLVEAGAKLDATDTVYKGTPLGWAMYMQTEEGYDADGKRKFADIQKYLEQKEKESR